MVLIDRKYENEKSKWVQTYAREFMLPVFTPKKSTSYTMYFHLAYRRSIYRLNMESIVSNFLLAQKTFHGV